jgi:hypothetical protein
MSDFDPSAVPVFMPAPKIPKEPSFSVSVKLKHGLLARVDRFCVKHRLDRSDGVRRLLEEALTVDERK